MSIKSINEGFKSRFIGVLTESTAPTVRDELRGSLEDAKNTVAHELKTKFMDMGSTFKLKRYEMAFQDVIEKLFPDKMWWEVVDFDIFLDLMEHWDPNLTINRIVDSIKIDDTIDEAMMMPAGEKQTIYQSKDGQWTLEWKPGLGYTAYKRNVYAGGYDEEKGEDGKPDHQAIINQFKKEKNINESVNGDETLNEISDPSRTISKVDKNLGKVVDKDMVRDLTLVIENDGEVYRRFTTPVIANLKRKKAKGQFDEKLAVQAFVHVVENALRLPHFYRYYSYDIKTVPVSVRYGVAKELLDGAMEEIDFEDTNESANKSSLVEKPVYDLDTQHDSRKSFYSKAKVDTGDNGDKNKLYSYNTLVAEMVNGKPVVYGTYSATTLRHIKEWLKQLGYKADNAKQIMQDYGHMNESATPNRGKRLKESTFRGVPGTEFIWHGSSSDPEISCVEDGVTYVANYWDVEDSMYSYYKEEKEYAETHDDDYAQELKSTYTFDGSDEDFNKFLVDHTDSVISDIVGAGKVIENEGMTRLKETGKSSPKRGEFFNESKKSKGIKILSEDVKVYRETDLTDFGFWSGALDRVEKMTDDELRQISFILEEMYPDGMTETEVNDIFWFEEDWIAEMLGYDSFDEIYNRNIEESLTESPAGDIVVDYAAVTNNEVDSDSYQLDMDKAIRNAKSKGADKVIKQTWVERRNGDTSRVGEETVWERPTKKNESMFDDMEPEVWDYPDEDTRLSDTYSYSPYSNVPSEIADRIRRKGYIGAATKADNMTPIRLNDTNCPDCNRSYLPKKDKKKVPVGV